MNIDIYNAPVKSVLVVCHTDMGDPYDIDGRFYEKGKEYILSTEIVKATPDTKNQECVLCWINFSSDGFGDRFAVKGNVYDSLGRPYWRDFKDFFVCPVAKAREEHLEKLGI